jgi:putative Mg2+ transporter-C (MgtC) family protein
MFAELIDSREIDFLIGLGLALVCGFFIGGEREAKGKPAGVSTQTLVIAGAMIFTFLSQALNEADPSRIAAQIVSGIGFLGAGLIIKSERNKWVDNATTAATIWYSAGVGMALGFRFYLLAVLAALYAAVVARLPNLPFHAQKRKKHNDV